MGAVYRAHDSVLGRDVAVKVMHPRYAREPEFQQRFLNEARAAARLDHPGIVKVFDYRQDGDYLYIVMKYIAGRNLHQRLQELRVEQQWLGLREAVQLVCQLGLALDYAHHKGVLHRDIKPANIMLEPEPAGELPYQPIITDLGLARLGEGLGITQVGVAMGTPFYMSPEQALGQVLDARSDVYSLGVLLYELVVGQLPFMPNTTSEAIALHTKQPPPLPSSLRSGLAPDLEHVILRALRKDPSARYPSATALVQALNALPASSLVAASPPPTVAAQVPPGAQDPAGGSTQQQLYTPALRGQSILGQFTTVDASTDSLQLQGPDGKTRTVLISTRVVTVGRNDDNTLRVDDTKISQHHMRIEYDGSRYRVIDLDSTNGTYMGTARLLGGVAADWDPQKPLRLGDHHMRLVLALNKSTAGAATGARSSQSAGAAAPLGFIQVVNPGQQVSIPVAIYNQSSLVDSFSLAVEGVPAAWVITPEPANLHPEQGQNAAVTLRPVLAPESRAGDYGVAIHVASRSTGQKTLLRELTLRVLPFYRVESRLAPPAVKPGRPAGVALRNLGNTPQRISIKWSDATEELEFYPSHAEVVVEPGQEITAPYAARLQRRRWFGGRMPHPFTVEVAAESGETKEHHANVLSAGVFPAWVPLLLLLLLVALGGFVFQQIGRQDPPIPNTGAIDMSGQQALTTGSSDQRSGNGAVPPTDTAVPATPTSQPTATPTVPPPPTPLPAPKFVVQDVANVRTGPGTNYPLVDSVASGQEFDLIAKSPDGQWWQICCVGGQQGWIYGQLGRPTRIDIPTEHHIPTPPPPTATNTSEPSPTPTNTPILPVYVIHSDKVDDRLICDLNGLQLFDLKLGQEEITLDITPLVRQGPNVLSCKVMDVQKGKSYSYNVSVYKGGEQVKVWKGGCTGQSCPVGSSTVLDGVFPFIYP